jgi:hypothetical protein
VKEETNVITIEGKWRLTYEISRNRGRFGLRGDRIVEEMSGYAAIVLVLLSFPKRPSGYFQHKSAIIDGEP